MVNLSEISIAPRQNKTNSPESKSPKWPPFSIQTLLLFSLTAPHLLRRRVASLASPKPTPFSLSLRTCHRLPPRSSFAASSDTFAANSVKNGVLTVGDFMTTREDLHVVNPTTTVDEAIELLVENRITGFPVIDGDWKLVGLVSDYDLLALDTISGGSAKTDSSMFPEVDSSWKTFNEVQKLLSKTNGQVVGDVMTPAPVVRETTNLENVSRILLETKYRRLPVVDENGKLVGIITRGNIIRAALQMKHASERKI